MRSGIAQNAAEPSIDSTTELLVPKREFDEESGVGGGA